MVFVVAGYRVTVIGHIQKQIASHDAETNQAYFVLLFTHYLFPLSTT
jgi:hypothetical protein